MGVVKVGVVIDGDLWIGCHMHVGVVLSGCGLPFSELCIDTDP